jgi:hypothetical protein
MHNCPIDVGFRAVAHTSSAHVSVHKALGSVINSEDPTASKKPILRIHGKRWRIS